MKFFIVIAGLLCGLLVLSSPIAAQQPDSYSSKESSSLDFDALTAFMQNNFANFLGGSKGDQYGRGELDVGQYKKGEGKKDHKGTSKEKFSESTELEFKVSMNELMSKPYECLKEFMSRIQRHMEEMLAMFKKSAMAAMGASLKPVISILKIVEGWWAPDGCSLRSLCRYGSNIDFAREPVGRIPPSMVEESLILKAILKGASGGSCEEAFICESKGSRMKDNYGPSAGAKLASKQQSEQVKYK